MSAFERECPRHPPVVMRDDWCPVCEAEVVEEWRAHLKADDEIEKED